MLEIVSGLLSGISVILWVILLVAFNCFWGAASALLAPQKKRKAANWFFLSLFYGPYGLILLACSKTLSKVNEYTESDTLSKVLWCLLAAFLVLGLTLGLIIFQIISETL